MLAVCGALVGGGAYVLTEEVRTSAIGANQDGALAAAGGFAVVLGAFCYGAGQTGVVYKLVADGTALGVANAARTRSGDSAADESADADEKTTLDDTERADRAGDGTGETVSADEDGPLEPGPGEAAFRTDPAPTDAADADAGEVGPTAAAEPTDHGEGSPRTGGQSTDDRPGAETEPADEASGAASSVEGGPDDGPGQVAPETVDRPAESADDPEAWGPIREDDSPAGGPDGDDSVPAGTPADPEPNEGVGTGAEATGDETGESPEVLMSESEVAEKLGFGQSATATGSPDDPSADVDTSPDRTADESDGVADEDDTDGFAVPGIDLGTEEAGDGGDDGDDGWSTGPSHVDRE